MQFSNLITALRLLGCFTSITKLEAADVTAAPSGDPVFKEYFLSSVTVKQFCSGPEGVPTNLMDACFVLRCLYDMALDHYDQ